MPLTIQSVDLKYKDTNGNYQPITCVTGSVPANGTEGQILVKASGTDYDTEWADVPVQDVQINGTSILSQGVANVPMASSSALGAVKVNYGGLQITSDGIIRTSPASTNEIKNGAATYVPITPIRVHEAAFFGLAKVAGADAENASNNTISNNVGSYSETSRSKIHDLLNAPVTVSGSTPSITAKSGIQYKCGTVTEITIMPCTSGICDVIFTTGTSTTLTVIPPTGTTMKWPDWFDPTALEDNTTYELNILDGVYGAVGVWA